MLRRTFDIFILVENGSIYQIKYFIVKFFFFTPKTIRIKQKKNILEKR